MVDGADVERVRRRLYGKHWRWKPWRWSFRQRELIPRLVLARIAERRAYRALVKFMDAAVGGTR